MALNSGRATRATRDFRPTARPGLIALLIALLATLATLAGPATARPRNTTTTTPPTTAPPLPAFASTLAWSDCGDGFQCATLTVPVDWSQPAGETMGIAMSRLPATQPDQRIGTIVVNYGGPGQGGVDYLRKTYGRLPEELRARFDVVTFDPRGTGASRPVDCVDDAVLDQSVALPAFVDNEAALTAQQQWSATFAQGCGQRMGAYAGQVGTRNVARDIEAMRIALGEPKLSYLGYSYGSVLGEAYAQMYPSHVRTMVLDGPPDYSLSVRDYDYQQAKGFADALSAFLAWCEQTQCSLTAAGSPRDALNGLIERTKTQTIPADYTIDGATRSGTLNGNTLQTGVLSLLYDQQRGWPLLGDALRSAAVDNWGGPLLAYADSYLGRDPDGKYSSSMVEANAVINCVDRPAAQRQPTNAAILADVAVLQQQLPPWGGSWALPSCVGMPKPAKGDKLGKVKVAGAPPILVIGNTGDPATPYAGAQATVARIAGSTLLTVDSTEHTAYGSGRSTCVDAAVDRYLVDGTVPAPGTHCAPG
jgi:pimeloyl-ACP methyl ester carboxylesterase